MSATARKIATGAVLLASLTGLLAGCGTGGVGGSAVTPPVAASTTVLRGNVHGGQQGVSGATIQLYAAGIGGLKATATPLIGTTVLTNPDGTFNISGDWNCTSNTNVYGVNPELYIVATGGNPGLATPAGANGALALMSALGPCNGIGSSSFITINEITTVASVVALAPFMADIADVGGQGANSIGIVNAFKTANVLANMATGVSPGAGVPSNVSVPVTEIITLADILAGCVNSNGGGGGCTNLFNLVKPGGGPLPTNTIAAMLDICASPANNVGNLLGLVLTNAPFEPALISPPNDWTVALNFTGGGLSAPSGIALDAGGNVWVANASGNSITGLSSTGTLLTGTAGYTANDTIFGAQGIAVDLDGNVWVADTLLNSVLKLSVSGSAVQASATFTSGGINGPTALAIDSQSNVWISNFAGGSVTELSKSGAVLGSSPLTAGGTLVNPASVAIDAAGSAWVTDNSAAILAKFSSSQVLLSGAGYTDTFMLAPVGIAFDSAGRAAVADNGIDAVSLYAPNGASALSTPATGGGLALPTGIAIDGQGAAWVTNSLTAGSLTQLGPAASAAISPATGLGSLNAPYGVAVDASGSIWTTNSGDDSVSEIVGAAVPAAMPLAVKAGP